MTDDRTDQSEWQALAAEHALGVLTGPDRLRAERLAARDMEFAAEVARWRGRLAPLSSEYDAVTPPSGMWARIETALGGSRSSGDNVVALRRRVNFWRAATTGITAIAASLAVVLLMQPQPASPPPPTEDQKSGAAPMVAMLGDQDNMKVMATWDPHARQLVLAVAGDMPADPSHAHEVWVIPAGGKPRSLGTMPPTKQAHMRLAEALAQLLQQGATIAISVEPAGGSPTGAPTGPVVASGALTSA